MQENLGDFTIWKGFFFFKNTQTIRKKKYRKKCKLSKVAMTSSLQRTFEKASYELGEKLIKHV